MSYSHIETFNNGSFQVSVETEPNLRSVRLSFGEEYAFDVDDLRKLIAHLKVKEPEVYEELLSETTTTKSATDRKIPALESAHVCWELDPFEFISNWHETELSARLNQALWDSPSGIRKL